MFKVNHSLQSDVNEVILVSLLTFEYILHFFILFLLLSVNKYMFAGLFGRFRQVYSTLPIVSKFRN